MFRASPPIEAIVGRPALDDGRHAIATRSAPGWAALALILGFVACLVGRLVSPHYPAVLLVWLGSGVALAFAWRRGPLWVLPAAAGAAAWTGFDTGDPWLATVAFAATAAGPAVAAALMSRLGVWKPADYRLDASLRFALAVVLVAAPIDALIAAAGLPATIGGGTTTVLQRLLGWWLVDALGMLLLAPALMAWLDDERKARADSSARRLPLLDVGALVAALAVLAGSIGFASFGHPAYAQALLFLYFPIVAWTAIRCDEDATAVSMLLVGAPLLAVGTWQARTAGLPPAHALEVSVLLFCAVIVAVMMQATASDRRFALERMAHQAREDLSTGLLNDRGLIAELGERLAMPARPAYGLIGLHLANIDTLNDLCGAIQAMQLEQGVAASLRRQPGMRAAARLSAGRFALLVEADSISEVRSIARELYSQLNGQLFRTEHGGVRLQTCVGGLLIDRNAVIDSEDCLVSLADAMAIAASVREPQLFVEPLSQAMIDARRSHQGRIEQIREAIREQRFSLHAQPMIDPDAPEGMQSYEILLRLLDRDGSLIRPPAFMSLAVQAQMTPAMDRGVIQTAFAWLAAHPDALARTWKCSINLSGLTMSDGTIAGFIREQRAAYAIPAARIVFEITESEAIRNPAAASRLVDDLKAEGFGIALDDFGTGLATFEYLKRFPIDYLKIDGSFIRNLVTSPIDEEIVMSTVRVARRLNVRTVAEHVHNQAVFDRVTELGVEYMQGELIGKPVPLASFFSQPQSRPARTGGARSGPDLDVDLKAGTRVDTRVDTRDDTEADAGSRTSSGA